MVELCTHSAIERAGLETLHLQQARLPSTLPEGGLRKRPVMDLAGSLPYLTLAHARGLVSLEATLDLVTADLARLSVHAWCTQRVRHSLVCLRRDCGCTLVCGSRLRRTGALRAQSGGEWSETLLECRVIILLLHLAVPGRMLSTEHRLLSTMAAPCGMHKSTSLEES